MKKFGLALALSTAAWAVPAAAADFSFTGTFTGDNNVQFFDFTATAGSTITLRSYSYAGGTNAAGTTILRGGFDPILTLYDLATGNRIAFQDDGSGVPVDPVTGAAYDVNFSQLIGAGNYRVALSEYANFGGTTLAAGFPYTSPTQTQAFCSQGIVAPFCDATGAKRDGHWAFDILNVANATQGGAVPEPATWAMMIVGFGLVGGAMRRQRIRARFAIA